jgi:hypothetical protein
VLADPANKPVLDLMSGAAGGTSGMLDDSSFISALDQRLARPFQVGFAESIDLVLLIAAAVMVIAIVLAVLLPELPLRNVSGIQGRVDAEAAAAALVAEAESAPDEGLGRVLEDGRDVGEEERPERAVDEPVVEGQR